MMKYICGIESYDLFVNIGSILGSILMLTLCYKKSKSWKKSLGVFLISLAIVELGFFPGRFVRGLSYWEFTNLLSLVTEPQGTHFIGRVIFIMWVFPLVFSLIYRKSRGEWKEYLDIFTIFLTFQHIFNRLACLFNGCCTGSYYNGFGALRYPENGETGAGYSYPVYPTQLFEIICMIGLLIILILLYRKGKRVRYVFCFGFAGTIFLSEFMINKSGIIIAAGLTVIQYAAILLAVTGAVMMTVERKEV